MGGPVLIQWEPIAGHSGYYVSRAGLVRSTRHGRDFILAQKVTRYGYCEVSMKGDDGRVRTCKVHRLVAFAFIGPQPDGLQINHKNLDKADNRAENLEWVTASENMRHVRRLRGPYCARGERHSQAKLTDAQVVEIRAIRGSGPGCTAVAKMYGVTHGAISMIWSGKRRAV